MQFYSSLTLTCKIFVLLWLSTLVKGGDFYNSPWDSKLPSNKLGIFVNTMVRIEWKYHNGIEMWHYNRKYMDEESEEVIEIMCQESLKEDAKIGTWTNCTTNSHTLTAARLIDKVQEWDQNVTYKEVIIKPFRNSDGKECVFNEMPRKLFYLSVVSVLFRTSLKDAEEDEPIIKLDKFFPHALNFWKDLIDIKLIYDFEAFDFITRPKGYNCLLSLVSEDSIENIKKHCSFHCKSETKTKSSSRIEL